MIGVVVILYQGVRLTCDILDNSSRCRVNNPQYVLGLLRSASRASIHSEYVLRRNGKPTDQAWSLGVKSFDA